MDGNITEEGIKAELEWMHRVGLSGYQNFDAALQTPQVMDKRLAYMTPEWKKAFVCATSLADQFGMEVAIAGSPRTPSLAPHDVCCSLDDLRSGHYCCHKTTPRIQSHLQFFS